MRKALAINTVIAMLLFGACADESSVRKIVGREIFVDDHFIDEMTDVKLVLHNPRYEGVALKLNKPWEGAFSSYFTVLKDGPKYRMYYRGQPIVGKDGNRGEYTCYAESEDGIHWSRPALGMHSFEGVDDTNILFKNDPPFSHNFSPFIDTKPGVPPAERYKALAGTANTGLFGFVSADGVNWKKLSDRSLFDGGRGTLDSQNVAFWSPAEDSYLLYYRKYTWGVRTVARAVSPDFSDWSPGSLMEYSDTDSTTPSDHIYTNGTLPYFRAPHIYLGLAKRFYPDRALLPDEVAQRLVPNPAYRRSSSDSILLSSRGGNIYERTFLEPYIRVGEDPKDKVSRSNAPAWGVVASKDSEQGRLYVYRISHYAQPSIHLSRYSLRLDGFASVQAGDSPGQMVTPYFELPENIENLSLNLNLLSSGEGYVQVTLESQAADEVELRSKTIVGDHLDVEVEWESQPTSASWPEGPVRLRFEMKNADLYSFNWDGLKSSR